MPNPYCTPLFPALLQKSAFYRPSTAFPVATILLANGAIASPFVHLFQKMNPTFMKQLHFDPIFNHIFVMGALVTAQIRGVTVGGSIRSPCILGFAPETRGAGVMCSLPRKGFRD